MTYFERWSQQQGGIELYVWEAESELKWLIRKVPEKEGFRLHGDELLLKFHISRDLSTRWIAVNCSEMIPHTVVYFVRQCIPEVYASVSMVTGT
jgi:hypothetical protein